MTGRLPVGHGLDNCPTCGRRITDFDPAGCELPTGQRWCLAHLSPADHRNLGRVPMCAYGCGLAAAPGDIYCAGCRSGESAR